MELVREVRWNFPGLETQAALEAHRETVLRMMKEHRALYVKVGGRIAGVLLFSKKRNQIACLAVAPEFRRQGIGSALLNEALKFLDRGRAVTVTTFRAEDEKGAAPRVLYRRFGFREGKLTEEFGYPVQEFLLPANTLPERIHAVNDYERQLFGACRKSFRPNLECWYSSLRPDQMNNNFYFSVGPLRLEDIRAAVETEKARGLNGLMLRMERPMEEDLKKEFGFEEERLLVMALLQDTSGSWKKNRNLEIRDIQTSDISADLLDVSGVPEAYRDLARRNMELVLEVAEGHPEYHWYCGYLNGEHVANVYALSHGGCVEIDDLWVAEGYRHRYIGTSMLKHIAENLPGIKYLHADAARTPREMYTKIGFETVETVYDYYLEW